MYFFIFVHKEFLIPSFTSLSNFLKALILQWPFVSSDSLVSSLSSIPVPNKNFRKLKLFFKAFFWI